MAMAAEWLVAVEEQLVTPLVATLTAFEQVQARWHPPRVRALAADLAPFAARLAARTGGPQLDAAPPEMAEVATPLKYAREQALEACRRFTEGPDDRRALGAILSATRCYTRACEALYPLAAQLPTIDRFLAEPLAGGSGRTAPRDRVPDPDAPGAAGVVHDGNGRNSRGGYSVYVPELRRAAYPLVVALHGGGGHGADFLWTWVKAARTRGFILAAPTSVQNTWSLREPDLDVAPLLRMVREIRARWPIDSEHMMISGWSDGGTYGMMIGVGHDSPFTHISSCSGSLHPRVVSGEELSRVQDKPIYLVHGAVDYMFPVENARRARVILTRVGADLTYREVPDLSHNWSVSESGNILDWFDPSLAR